MLDRSLMTFCILLYAVAVPHLEVNATHVFNPEWVAHARLHEVWQLFTNTWLGMVSLWWVWGPGKRLVLPSMLALSVTCGFMAAYILRDLYGGSMVHPDGTEKVIWGTNVGVLGFGFVIAASIFTLARGLRLERSRARSQGIDVV